jgi:hypothetical protein
MTATGTQRNDASQRAGPRRERMTGGGAIAKLTVLVLSPTPRGRVASKRAGEESAGDNRDERLLRIDDARDVRLRGRNRTELVEVVAPPAPRLTGGGYGARVRRAGGDTDKLAIERNALGHRT